MFVVMPVLAVALDKAFDFRHEIEVALVALSLSPVPPLLMKKEDKAGGSQSYALGLLVTMGVLSLAVVPLAMGQALFDAAPVLKSMVVLPASGHNDINHADVAAKVMSLLSE